MSPPSAFLVELAHALAASQLYSPGHPARNRAIESAYRALIRLRMVIPRPSFTFLGDEVVCGSRPLRDLRSWDWATRLADAGVQRLEFLDGVAQEEFEDFIDALLARLTAAAAREAATANPRANHIRFGTVGVRSDSTEHDGSGATTTYALGAEAEAVRWIQDEARDGAFIGLSEAKAVVSSLAVALNDDKTLLPLLRMARFDQYLTCHALNVTTLTMAFARHLGMSRDQIQVLGLAALVHDVGKMTIPLVILNKPTRLSEDEIAIVQEHPAIGARLILRSGDAPDIAAVVAYEHHMHFDGSGYPSFRYSGQCHRASRLVQLCDVYDAMRSPRHYRDGWPAQRALDYLQTHAGTEFDPQLVPAFVSMMSKLEEVPAVPE